MKTEPIKSFEQATTITREILKGTKFEKSSLTDCGGGDGKEDIKPLLIAEVEPYRFMAVGFPEGGILFTITDDEALLVEYEDFNDAISEWEKLV